MRAPSVPVFLTWCLMVFVVPAAPRADPSFTSADIVEATTAVDCLDWKVRGICLKLKCGLFGCRIRTVPWVEHRIPDLVVSAYNEPGRIPWTKARALYGRPLAAAADAVTRTTVGVPLGGGHRTVTRPGGALIRVPSPATISGTKKFPSSAIPPQSPFGSG